VKKSTGDDEKRRTELISSPRTKKGRDTKMGIGRVREGTSKILHRGLELICIRGGWDVATGGKKGPIEKEKSTSQSNPSMSGTYGGGEGSFVKWRPLAVG